MYPSYHWYLSKLSKSSKFLCCAAEKKACYIVDYHIKKNKPIVF